MVETMATHPIARMTEEEYLSRERDAEYKSEYRLPLSSR